MNVMSWFKKDHFMLSWEPKEDITAYELALCMRLLIPIEFRDDRATFEALSDGAKRHWRVVS